ncbi:MAG: GMC family oxidoreductase, partial [Bradymonadaceae bacterium]
SGWPIDREDLDPYYRRAVDTLDLGAHEWTPGTIAERNDETLLPFDDLPAATTVYQFSPPTEFDDKYRSELESHDDVEVFLHANLVHVGLAPNGRSVDHLECKTPEGTSFTARADTYVLAMGGIENPRMLLASDDVHSDGIGNAHDNLGRYFMEHPRLFGIPAVFVTRPDIDVASYFGRPKLTYRDDQRGNSRTAKSMLALEVPPQARRRRQLLGLSVTFAEAFDTSRDGHLTGRHIADTVGLDHDGDQRMFLTQLRTEQPPSPESRITLLDERDRLGVPRARLDWHIDDDYFESLRRSLLTLGSGLARGDLGRIWLSTDESGRIDHDFEGSHHHMGTTRMSDRPEDGVVDPDCRVHGVANLYVAGCSVFPTAGYANPTFTLVALAHRLSDHLTSNL